MRHLIYSILSLCIFTAFGQYNAASIGVYAKDVKYASDGNILPHNPAISKKISHENLAWFSALHNAMCERVDVPSSNFKYTGKLSKTSKQLAGCASPSLRASFAEIAESNSQPALMRQPMLDTYDQVRVWLHTNGVPVDVEGILVYPLCTENIKLKLPANNWTIFREGSHNYSYNQSFDLGSPSAGPALGRIDETSFFYGGPPASNASWTNTIIKAWLDSLYAAGFNRVDANEYPSYFTSNPASPSSVDAQSIVPQGIPSSLNYYNKEFNPSLTNVIASAPAATAGALVSLFNTSPWFIKNPVKYVTKTETLDTIQFLNINSISNSIVEQGSSGQFQIDEVYEINIITNEHTITYATNTSVNVSHFEEETSPQVFINSEWIKHFRWVYSQYEQTGWIYNNSKYVHHDDGTTTLYITYKCHYSYNRHPELIKTEVWPYVYTMGSAGHSKKIIKTEIVEIIPDFGDKWPAQDAWQKYKFAMEYVICGNCSYDFSVQKGEQSSSSSIYAGFVNKQLGDNGDFKRTLIDIATAWPNELPHAYNDEPDITSPVKIKHNGICPAQLPQTEFFDGDQFITEKYVLGPGNSEWEYEGSIIDNSNDIIEIADDNILGAMSFDSSISPVQEGQSIDIEEDGQISGSTYSTGDTQLYRYSKSEYHTGLYIFGRIIWDFMNLTE